MKLKKKVYLFSQLCKGIDVYYVIPFYPQLYHPISRSTFRTRTSLASFGKKCTFMELGVVATATLSKQEAVYLWIFPRRVFLRSFSRNVQVPGQIFLLALYNLRSQMFATGVICHDWKGTDEWNWKRKTRKWSASADASASVTILKAFLKSKKS